MHAKNEHFVCQYVIILLGILQYFTFRPLSLSTDYLATHLQYKLSNTRQSRLRQEITANHHREDDANWQWLIFS